MNPHSNRRNNCRLCSSSDLELVAPIGLSPVSEKYLSKDKLCEQSIAVPLDLYFCLKCFHVQLLDVVEPKFLWSDFTFKTSRNPALIKHFQQHVKRILNMLELTEHDLVLDVGSNDGTLLKCFLDQGYSNILGVDPATEIVERANNDGLRTIEGFMNLDLSHDIDNTYGKAKLVTANNVFAHVDDLSRMAQAIKAVLADDGLFVFEVSYLLDVLNQDLIGTIFHEHLSYHSVISLVPFLSANGLGLIHVERGPEQGGSLVCYVQHNNGGRVKEPSVQKLVELEKLSGLDKAHTVVNFYTRLEKMKSTVLGHVEELYSKEKSIAGFGAARAGTTLLSYFGIGDRLTYLFDDNKSKHYKYSPGDKIEVLPTSSIYNKKPDCMIILAWIHADKIIETHNRYLAEGGRFMRLFPSVEIIKT